MAQLVDLQEVTNSSELDYNIHHIEVRYNALNDYYQTAKLTPPSNSSSQHHVLLNCIRSMSKTLFLMQRKLQLATKGLRNQLTQVQDKISNYQKEPEPRKRRKLTNVPVFTPTQPTMSYYFQYDGKRCEKNNLEYSQLLESGHQLLSHLPSPKLWREYDKQKLHDCVRRSIVRQQSQHVLDKLNKIYDMMKSTFNQKRIAVLEKWCEKLVAKAKQLRSCSLRDLLIRYPDCTLDWQFISDHWSRKRFTERECRLMWELVAYPLIMKESWSKTEDLLLNSIASQYNHENWDLVCDKLNTGRTPFLCFVRFRSYLKTTIRKTTKVYSESENKLVNEFIDKRCQNQYYFSNLVSQCGDITSKQLTSHIKHVVSSKYKLKGKFSSKDKYLIQFYTNRGYSHQKVSKLLRNRTPKQIYDYQLNSRISPVRAGKWSSREIQKLLTAVKYNGARRWSEISKYLENRSAASCYHKYRWLRSKVPDLIEVYSKRTPSVKDIKTMLRDCQTIAASRKPNSIDDEIETYFIEYLEKQPPPPGNVDAFSVGNSVLEILKFLDLKVDQNTDRELIAELGEWLLNFDRGDVNEPGPSKFDKMFENLNASKKDLKMTKNTTFTHVVPKNCPVLPPNKCTMYGLDTFQKNLLKSCKSSGVDLSALWNKINSANERNKEFIEAKLLFYRILKGLFYWPMKLNNLPPDSFL